MNKTLNTVKVILFDIDNTLLDFKQCARQAMIESFNKWNLEFKEEYLDIFLKFNDKYWDRYEKGEISRAYLYQNRWKDIFKYLGINTNGPAFEQDYVKCLYHSAVPVKGAQDLLEYLSDKYALYIVSNSSLDEQSERLRIAGLLTYFKEIFTSEDLGVAKPSKEFFNKVLNSLDNINKDEILIIGDSVSADIKGGKNAGIKTCWFNHKRIDKKVSEADVSVNDLLELKTIL